MIDSERTQALMAAHGPCEPQSRNDWTGAVALPEPLARFFAEVGPRDVTVNGIGNPTFFPSLAKLWDFQAGYRWNGVTSDVIADWPDEWIVVASEGGDPFIFDEQSGRVLHAMHGTGSWDAGEIAPDLNTLAASIALLGSVAADAPDLLDEESCEVKPEHQRAARERLLGLLGDELQTDVMISTMGWD